MPDRPATPTPHYSAPNVTLYAGDCLDVLRTLPDASVDAVVTDPPYSIGFMGRTWDSHGGNEDAAFAYWFSGFTDGEGCFRVQRHERGTFTCTFSIKVRRDERGTLERIQRFFGGIGTIRDGEGSGNAHPQTMWAVQDKAGCARLVQHFDKYPLRAKKRLDFEPWAQAVLEWHNMKRGNRWHGKSDWSRMAELKARVEGARQYVDPPWSGHGFQDWTRLWAAECYRILKPGGHLLAFGGTRQFHRLTAGVEDAGFEVRDSIAWLYGSGFPKSLDVSKAIDKAAGAEREVVGDGPFAARRPRGIAQGSTFADDAYEWQPGHSITTPATDDARTWQGWGTALKPAFEPIVVARKPLVGTVAANVLTYGTGALNVDGCRVGLGETEDHAKLAARSGGSGEKFSTGIYQQGMENDGGGWKIAPAGRWPANVVLDEDQAAALDEQSGDRPGFSSQNFVNGTAGTTEGWGNVGATPGERREGFNDSGGASRFFYTAKADSGERVRINGTAHPTVKPLSLMRWLVRLVTPPGGLVLDPFAGSGTTGEACLLEGFQSVLIEREADYLPLIVQRINRRRDPVAAVKATDEDRGLFDLLGGEGA